MGENRMMSLAALVKARNEAKADPKLMVALCRDAIARKDAAVRAFAHVAPDPVVTEGGPLSGVAIGVKDIFDTFDQPTTYGSPVYEGHRPRVDAAIVDGSAHMMNLLMSLGQSGSLSMTRGQSLLDGPHWCRSYACADGGHVAVQCLEPKFYAEFLRLLDLADDPDFARQHDRALWPALGDRLAAIFAAKPRDHWAALFSGSDGCVAPVLSPREAMAHPLNEARQTWHDPDGVLQAAPAPRFSGRPPWRPPEIPKSGQYTETILAELAENPGA